MADASEQGLVEIIPLEGNYAPIKLTGGALPYKGTTFAREQRGKTTYYTGNPVATQTVTGPTRPPTTMTGRWMDFDLGEGGARALDLQIGILCDKGVPVEVRWGGRALTNGEDPAIVQRGRISKYEPKYNRAQDIEWSITFEWRGDALQTKPPTFSASIVKQDSFTELSEVLEETQEATQSWIDIAWSGIATGTNEMLAVSDALDEVQNAIFDATNVVNGASDMLQTAAELPSAIADRVRGMCNLVVMACANGRAALGSACGLFAGVLSTQQGGPVDESAAKDFRIQAERAQLARYPTDDPLSRLDGQTTQFDLVHQWDQMAAQAAQTDASIAAKQVPDIIAIVRPPAGSDLRDVAAKYYGNPDPWILIADFNDLDSSEVPATSSGPSDLGAPPIYVPAQASYQTVLQEAWGNSPTTGANS
jgi:hypothetical protein